MSRSIIGQSVFVGGDWTFTTAPWVKGETFVKHFNGDAVYRVELVGGNLYRIVEEV